MDEHLKRIQRDVDEMNKSFGHSISETTDAPNTDAPGTDAPSTEAPTTDAPAEHTDAPSTDAPTTDAPKDEIAELRAEIERLKAEKETKTTPKTSAPTTDTPLTDQDFVGDIDLDDLQSDKSALNKLFNKVYQKAVMDTRKTIGEGVLRQIPDIVKTNLVMMTSLKEASEKFYRDNEDLKPFKKVVATVFEEIASSNPSKKYAELLPEVAVEARKRLDLHKKTASHSKKDSKPPKLPTAGKSSPRGKEKPSTAGIESELEAMNSVLRR